MADRVRDDAPAPYRPTILTVNLASMTTAFERPEAFPLFAHQGGWDEILLVALPLILIGTLLYIANKRVDAKPAEQSGEEGQPRS